MHICDMLEYKYQKIDLVFPDTEYQRMILFNHDDTVEMQVVLFCPYCGKDFRSYCNWQIAGKPAFNEILRGAKIAGTAKTP